MLDPLQVEAVLPVSMFGRVDTGSVGLVALPAPIDRTVRAEVTVVERVIDAASGTFAVRLESANADYRLPAGMDCRVAFE